MPVHSYINSKINGTPKGFYLTISKLHSILSVANLLAHNNKTISYYMQVIIFGGTIYFAVDGTWYNCNKTLCGSSVYA